MFNYNRTTYKDSKGVKIVTIYKVIQYGYPWFEIYHWNTSSRIIDSIARVEVISPVSLFAKANGAFVDGTLNFVNVTKQRRRRDLNQGCLSECMVKNNYSTDRTSTEINKFESCLVECRVQALKTMK